MKRGETMSMERRGREKPCVLLLQLIQFVRDRKRGYEWGGFGVVNVSMNLCDSSEDGNGFFVGINKALSQPLTPAC